MSLTFSTSTSGTIARGATFAETGTMVHEGRTYSSGGAAVDDESLVAYLGACGVVRTWEGAEIGRYQITSSWRVQSYVSSELHQVHIRLADGRRYTGRSHGEGMIVTARRLASDKR